MTTSLNLPLKRFYSTRLAPCPYLPERLERKVFTELTGGDRDPESLHEALTAAGFRRSHGIAYKPICQGCDACVPVRVPVAAFAPSRSMRRVLSRNADVMLSERPAVATDEQFAVFARYEASRHGDGGMASMDFEDYRAMVEESPIRTSLFEFRRDDGVLLGAALTDQLGDGLSMVYSFFEPDLSRRSLGTYMILSHISHARRRSLAYLYLGYWIRSSRKMSYKARFAPLERLTASGWNRFEADEVGGV